MGQARGSVQHMSCYTHNINLKTPISLNTNFKFKNLLMLWFLQEWRWGRLDLLFFCPFACLSASCFHSVVVTLYDTETSIRNLILEFMKFTYDQHNTLFDLYIWLDFEIYLCSFTLYVTSTSHSEEFIHLSLKKQYTELSLYWRRAEYVGPNLVFCCSSR